MNIRLYLIVIAATVTGIACNPANRPADNAVVASSRLSSESYASVVAAVTAASNRYNPISIAEHREYMGAIIGNGSIYRYTVARGQMGADRISLRLALPYGMNVVAFWHTHGARHFSRQYFSAIDSALVRQWRKPLYLASHTGFLKVLKPGDHTLPTLKAARLGLGRGSGYAKGNKVLGAQGSPVRIATIRLAGQSH